MATSSWNAGIIRPVAVAPTGPYQDGAAPGVWTLDQVAFWQKQGLWPIAGNIFQVGLLAGIFSTNTVLFLNLSTTGNSTTFGTISPVAQESYACGSSTRFVLALGFANNTTYSNSLSYATFASTGSTATFGQLTVNRSAGASCNSSTRGIFAGGRNASSQSVIDYITIASTGNATSFGLLTATVNGIAGASSPTRGVMATGIASGGGAFGTINYITIASTGNASNFGNLDTATRYGGGCSNSTRALFAGGDNGPSSYIKQSLIQYITIATTGNSTTFGNLSTGLYAPVGLSSSIYGLFASGENTAGNPTNLIEYVTIATTGNATSWGQLTSTAYGQMGAATNVNGGTQ